MLPRTLTFVDCSGQSVQSVPLPSSLQTLTFSYKFDQTLEGVALPSSPQARTFGHDPSQSLQMSHCRGIEHCRLACRLG